MLRSCAGAAGGWPSRSSGAPVLRTRLRTPRSSRRDAARTITRSPHAAHPERCPARSALRRERVRSMARVRQGAAAARQPHGLGHAGGARGLASAPEGWSEGAPAQLLGRGDRDRAPAAPGLWSSVATDRGPAALTHGPARGEPRCARPHHVSRRSPGLALATALARAQAGGPVHVVIDATGLKVYGAGEWLVEKHGARCKRTWRKLHLAIDPSTGEILASELTSNEEGDASQVGPLLDQIPGPLASV